MDKDLRFSDAYSPLEIARKVESLGVAKARTDPLTLLVLAVLAGAFISLGALFFIVVVTKSTLGFGMTRLFGGLSFCLGLILVVVAGAELFTGNNLLVMAWASGRISTGALARSWGIVFVGNFAGAVATAWLVYLGVVPTALAYILYVLGLRTTPVTVSSVLTLMEPLTATMLGVLAFGDRLGALGVLGAVLLLGAVALLALTTRAGSADRPQGEMRSRDSSIRRR